MLTTAQILPFLEHADPGVRALALRYLSNAHDPSPATAEDIWRMIERFGAGPSHANYTALARMPHTQASLTRTLKAISESTHLDAKHHLENAVGRISHGLLARFSDLIEATIAISLELREHLHQRIELAGLAPMELCDRLEEHSRTRPSPDPQMASRLIEALSRNPEGAQWAIATLNDDSIHGWAKVYAVDLLGLMRFRSAAELILDRLTSPEIDRHLIESSSGALVHLGSVQVVQLLENRFGKLSQESRLMVAGVLGRIKLSQSETAVAKLLNQENDLSVRGALAEALCEMAATQGPILNELGSMAKAGNSALLREVTALFTMVGRSPPTIATKKTPAPFVNDMKHDEELIPAEEQNLMGDLAPKSQQAAALPKPKPLQRSSPKVGRNDPCLCGSGKKYKKCCGK